MWWSGFVSEVGPARQGIVFRLSSRDHSPVLGGWAALWVGRGPCEENHFFICGKAGDFTLQLVFCLPGWGQNHFFFCPAKEKVVLASEKEKVDRWK
jgi:hypothetical protein